MTNTTYSINCFYILIVGGFLNNTISVILRIAICALRLSPTKLLTMIFFDFNSAKVIWFSFCNLLNIPRKSILFSKERTHFYKKIKQTNWGHKKEFTFPTSISNMNSIFISQHFNREMVWAVRRPTK